MANYTFAATKEGIFIRHIKVTDYAVSRAVNKANDELKYLYPKTYSEVKIELVYCNINNAIFNKINKI